MDILTSLFLHKQLGFRGEPLAPGVVKGKVYCLKRISLSQILKDTYQVEHLESELSRVDFSVTRSKEQIQQFMVSGLEETKEISRSIFNSELHLLDDPNFLQPLKEKIRRTQKNAESVFAEEITTLQESTYTDEEKVLKNRLIIIQDIYFRILYNFLPIHADRISAIRNIPEGYILVADRLGSVEFETIPMANVVGILIEECLNTSQAFRMAQRLSIPVIINLNGIGPLLDESTNILIDAFRGDVFINPDDTTLSKYESEESQRRETLLLESPNTDTSPIHSAYRIPIEIQ